MKIEKLKKPTPGITKPKLVMVLDESGSMGHLRMDVINTFNEFTETNKDNVLGLVCYTFDSNGIRERINEPQAGATKLTQDLYAPAGGTPLYDAIATIIKEHSDETGPVQMVIHTDGHENASKEYDRASVKALIDQHVAKGWLFVYLGEEVGFNEVAEFSGLKIKMSSNINSRTSAYRSVGEFTKTYAQTNSIDTAKYVSTDSDTIDVTSGN